MNISLAKSFFGDKIQNFELTFENPYQDVDFYLRHVKQRLIELLNQEQQSHNGIKVKLSLKCIFMEKRSHGLKIQKSEKQFSTNLKTFNNEGEVDGMFKEIKDQMPTNENIELQKIVHLSIYVDSTKKFLEIPNRKEKVPLVVFVKFQEEEATSQDPELPREYVPVGFGCCLLKHNEPSYFHHRFKNENVFREFWEILETKVNQEKSNVVPIMIADFTKYTHCFLIRGLKREDDVTIKGSINTKVTSLIKKTMHTTLKCLDFSQFLPMHWDYDSNRNENIKYMVEIFQEVRKLCDSCGLDLANYSSLAHFAWNYMLKFRSENGEDPIPILEDEEKIEFIAKSIRGGLRDCSKRVAEANNIHVENYNGQDQQTFIVTLDLNNSYGWAMSQNLPWDNFRWVDEKQFADHYHVINLKENDETGYIFEVDLEYPEELHDEHSDMPFCCVHSTQPQEPRLQLNLHNKEKYVILDQNLKQCMNHGLKLKKIHRVLQFTKKPWLKDYVYYNTRLRNKSKEGSLERKFYKMLNTKICDKLNERFDKRHYTTVATKAEDLRNLNSNYFDRIIHGVHGDVVLFEFKPEKIKTPRPIFAMFAVLELSKMRMYQFHYDVMVKKYGKRLKLLRLYTDNFFYEIQTDDFYKDVASDPNLLAKFVPEGNLSKRKPEEVLGKMRDESDGKKVCKYYSTRYSNYFLRFTDGSCKPLIVSPALTAQEEETPTEEDFRKCIFEDQPITLEREKTFTEECKVFKTRNREVLVEPGDPKRYIKEDKINTLAKGHKGIPSTSN
jgi:hypothetical protein